MTANIAIKNARIAQLEEDKRKSSASESLYQKALGRLWRDRLTMTMIFILLVLVVFALGAPVIETVLGTTYTDIDLENKFAPVGAVGHPLGTDDLGRDQLARLAYAGRVTLGIAFVAAIISIVIGIALGIIMGYYGGVVDDFILWVITTLTSIPSLFLLIIIAAIFRPGPVTITLVLGLLGWTGTTRLVRGETLSLREREFVISARAMGASPLHIMWQHILPNLISVLVITLAIDIGGLMLTEAALSFLGIGVQPPTPTWGNMLSNSRDFIRTPNAWQLIVFPGLLITFSVLCFYVIGDGVRDAFDPMIRQRSANKPK